ncbi:unnamed protein product [Lymnaea stagnalis]|uniref:Polynucleotide 5'-hydroxyl-kinase NOL9 n=1 Tax=Lymnaea stagnalis TaxID=6523 RepID=A0AAV2I2X5_LYMST
MSHLKRSHLSAYQVYLSSDHSKSNRHKQHYISNSDLSDRFSATESSSRNIRKSKNSGSRSLKKNRSLYDSDEEVLKVYSSKSLEKGTGSLSNSKKMYSAKHQSLDKMSDALSRRNDRKERSLEGEVKSTQSLMDIDFSHGRDISSGNVSKWKDVSSHHEHSSEEDHSERRSDWKSNHKLSKYSDSEEEEEDFWNKEKAERNRRAWKESTTMTHSSSSSRHAPLIVEMPERLDSNGSRKPKPLLETYVSLPTKKPVSLLDLPSRGGDGFKRKISPRPRQTHQKNRSESNLSSSRNATSNEERPPGKKQKLDKSINDARDNSNKESNKITICKIKGHTFLLIPASSSQAYIHGRAKITVLLGNVNILAYKLHIGTTYDVYSPASCSLLAMNINETPIVQSAEVKKVLSKYGVPENDKDFSNIGTKTISVIKVDKLASVVCDYITNFIPYTQLFRAAPSRDIESSSLRGVTLAKVGLKVAPLKEMVSSCMHMSPEYEDVLAQWSTKLSDWNGGRAPIVVCCGAKNTGKSTFNRMLINTSLKSLDAVAFLDCDVGQSELSPPATLSLHIIRQPILEPPFCHQKQAEKMVFYGDTSPTQDPGLYIKCLRHVFETYKELSPSHPLIVNTMGFPEAIGLMLLIDTMNIVEPDLVIQIESFSQVLNYPAITHDLVALDEGWSYNKLPVEDPSQKISETHAHKLLLLSTLVSQRRDFSFKLKPVDLRNLSLLSALSSGLERSMTLTSSPPFTVPYKLLGIHVCHNRVVPEEILNAIDASVVALCVADLSLAIKTNDELPLTFDDMPICSCLGLGIVRGIDTAKGLLYIVTPLPKVSLRKMNTILKGSLTLPDQIIFKQKSSSPVPYVDALARSTAVASVRPRARMPRLSLGKQ